MSPYVEADLIVTPSCFCSLGVGLRANGNNYFLIMLIAAQEEQLLKQHGYSKPLLRLPQFTVRSMHLSLSPLLNIYAENRTCSGS